jgi:hypothetical protein
MHETKARFHETQASPHVGGDATHATTVPLITAASAPARSRRCQGVHGAASATPPIAVLAACYRNSVQFGKKQTLGHWSAAMSRQHLLQSLGLERVFTSLM